MQKTKKYAASRAPHLSRFNAMLNAGRGIYDPIIKGSLIARNVRINGRRTSVRLHELGWQALEEAAKAENLSIDDFCTGVDSIRPSHVGFTTVLRAFLLAYYRARARQRQDSGATKH